MLVDINGHAVHEGDIVAYAVPDVHHRVALDTYRILSIGKEGDRWGDMQDFPVEAEVVHTKRYYTREGTIGWLHGRLFDARALLIAHAE